MSLLLLFGSGDTIDISPQTSGFMCTIHNSPINKSALFSEYAGVSVSMTKDKYARGNLTRISGFVSPLKDEL